MTMSEEKHFCTLIPESDVTFEGTALTLSLWDDSYTYYLSDEAILKLYVLFKEYIDDLPVKVKEGRD